MAKGYWIAALTVNDPDAYKAYQAFVRPFLARNNGRFVVRGGQQVVVEGSVRPRIIVVEFPSFADAERVYHSAEYQEGMKLRLGGVAVSDLVIVEGFDG
jgi:uncharacterized protein (DUF1330 family)